VDVDAGRHDAERVGVDALVALALPSVGIELLVEVALGVQQADADERDTEVGTRLQVVAGEHAEAAGVLGQASVIPNSGEKYATDSSGLVSRGRTSSIRRA
jgi:hypothetical protein